MKRCAAERCLPASARGRDLPFLARALLAWLLLHSFGAWADPPGDVLRVLAWPGYADPDIVREFERRTDSKVEITFVDSDATLWRRVSDGDGGRSPRTDDEGRSQPLVSERGSFDVFAVNTAELQRYVGAGLVLPIDTAALPNLAAQLPRFRRLEEIPGLVHDGRVYAIPYAYAEMGLIYDRHQLAEAPTSLAALWDPAYRGRVLAFNDGPHNFSIAALSLGLPPFQIGEADWERLAERLIDLRRNALTFYAQPEESVTLFVRRRVALMLANYGAQQLQLLRAAGADVGYAIPREGALAWLDCWALTRDVRNRQLAEAWINYLLEAHAGEVLSLRHGLGSTTFAAANDQPSDALVWLQPAENVERRNHLWQRILAGDRLSRVMTP